VAKKSLSARIDEEIYESIVSHCQERQISQAQLLEQWAREFFSLSHPDNESNENLDDRIEAALERLAPDLMTLPQTIAQLQELVLEQSDRLKKSKPKPKGFG
jgi:hypothetical protein